MPNRFRPAVLLVATLILLTAAACSGLPATPAERAGPSTSVQDQLAQLAGGAHATSPLPQPSSTPTAAKALTPSRASSDALPTITEARLPKEARDTIRLILQGGPFPYDKDGATFGNREGLLPKRANGYYKEYTVITPSSRDRGARRIVAGQGGEFYYTDDHYDSFKRVVQ